MNERIRELAKEAGMVNILNEHAHEYGNGTFEDTPYPEMDKFVELIVRECLDCIAKVHKTEYTKEFNEGYTLGVERCFYKIEEHFFGVEE